MFHRKKFPPKENILPNMKLKSLLELVSEDVEPNILFVLEDLYARVAMISAYVRKYGLNLEVVHKENNEDAIEYVKNNRNRIKFYSIDYNLSAGETTEQFAKFLYQDGIAQTFPMNKVYIHSDDSEGIKVLKYILPNAIVAKAPDNISLIQKSY